MIKRVMILKRLPWMACLALLAASPGCGALPLPITVTTTGRAVIEKGTVVEQAVGGVGFSQFTAIDFSQSQEFKNNNVQKKHVSEARVKEITLTIELPAGQSFDFLESVMFYIEAPGLEKKRLAHKKVPRGVSRFTCELEDLDIAPYVRADTMQVTTSVKGRRPDAETTLEARLSVKVGTVLLRFD